MTQPMQIQSAVIPACEPESMKAVDAGCVKAGSRIITSDLAGVVCQLSRMASCSIKPGMTQRGFSLVSAIFLLVVIAMLGTFAVTLSTTQQQSSALDVLGSRAYQAARAGIEWGAYQVLRNGGACAPTTTLPAMTGTLSGFNVSVTCASTPYTDGVPVTVYQLTSTATQGTVATPSYIERQMTVTIAK